MLQVVAKVIAKNPPSILIVFGGLLAVLQNPNWGIFVLAGVVLQAIWLYLRFR